MWHSSNWVEAWLDDEYSATVDDSGANVFVCSALTVNAVILATETSEGGTYDT
jgi:hypothetical protein